MKLVSIKCMFFGLMTFAILATFICGVVLISASTDSGVAMDLNWSHGITGTLNLSTLPSDTHEDYFR
jgi:hypothetical protein